MEKELKLEAKLENITHVISFVETELELLNCPMKTTLLIDTVIDELFSNIAMYAYGDSIGYAWIKVDYDPDKRLVTFKLSDEGIPYNPLEKDDPDITLEAEDRPIGGLGIYIAKKAMDTMTYERKDGKNILTLGKVI